MKRRVSGFAVTNDFHSSWAQWGRIESLLAREYSRNLLVDSGDFFEGSGYYRLAGGVIERHVLLKLYDYLTPGNHGYAHYLSQDMAAKTLCANVVEGTRPVFLPVQVSDIAGRKVAITGVLGSDAFSLVPYSTRRGQTLLDPAKRLRELHEKSEIRADDWVVFSHSGWHADLELVNACPFISVIFSGHCHSAEHGPCRIGRTWMVKGREDGGGIAVARLVTNGAWKVATLDASLTSQRPHFAVPGLRLEELLRPYRPELERDLGKIRAQWRHTLPEPEAVLRSIIERARRILVPEAWILMNVTSIRKAHLSTTLTVGDLLQLEPFGNQLVYVDIPESSLPELRERLERFLGRVILVPSDVAESGHSGKITLVTTRYLAETHLSGDFSPAGISIADLLISTLTEPVEE